MKPDEIQGNLEITFVNPVVVSDANLITTNDQGACTIAFLQLRKQENGMVYADAVASVFFPNIGGLKELRKSIDEQIRKHENKEK